MALLMANTKKGEKGGRGDQYKRDLRLSRDCLFFFFSRSHKYTAAEEKFSPIYNCKKNTVFFFAT